MGRLLSGIWGLVGVTKQGSSSLRIIVIVIIESWRDLYWIMFLVTLVICRFCLLVRLFLAIVAMIKNCAMSWCVTLSWILVIQIFVIWLHTWCVVPAPEILILIPPLVSQDAP